MSRYLKKFAGCGARPAIQYVLNEIREALLSTPGVKPERYTHMVDTTRVGIMRSGTTSKRRRTNNQAVGLSHKKRTCEDHIGKSGK
jgi:hypothetical protein